MGRYFELRRLCYALLDEYAMEEEEHGFPFNLRLRDAHRDLKRFMESS